MIKKPCNKEELLVDVKKMIDAYPDSYIFILESDVGKLIIKG